MDEAHKEFAGIEVTESPHQFLELLQQLCTHFGFSKLGEQFSKQSLYSPANDYTVQSDARRFCTHCGDKKVGIIRNVHGRSWSIIPAFAMFTSAKLVLKSTTRICGRRRRIMMSIAAVAEMAAMSCFAIFVPIRSAATVLCSIWALMNGNGFKRKRNGAAWCVERIPMGILCF